jgi:RNA polymerase sigma-70 factor (ECF subfamily)
MHFDELSTRRYPALLSYASLLTGQRATAEDLVQDALLRTFGRPRSLPSIGHAEAYVRRAILTIFLDSTRRRSTLVRAFTRVAERPVQADATHAVDDQDQVSRALAQLAPQVRAAVVMRFYEDLTIAEVAARMGIATGTAKRYLSDGTARLREIVGGEDQPDDATDTDLMTTASVIVESGSTRRNP